jgi:hypothetical protein
LSVWDASGNLPIAEWCDNDEFHRPDATFIANAPMDMRRLIKAMEAVTALADGFDELASEASYSESEAVMESVAKGGRHGPGRHV